MQKIKALIIDDDAFIHHQLCEKLMHLSPEIAVEGLAESALEGLHLIHTMKPDLVFLDIQLPDGTGFQMLNEIAHPSFSVIFITAFNQYAIQALRYSALDYLLKPIKNQDLIAAVARFHERQSPKYLTLQIENLMHNLGRNDGDFKLVIASRSGDFSLPIRRILWCEGDSNYTHFHLSDRSKVTASKTLKEFEELLSEKDFLRVHKSHLVNVAHISHITPEGQLILQNDHRLEVAKRRLSEVRRELERRKHMG